MIRALRFLNLLDSDGNLSITNVCVIVCVVKIVVAPQFSVTEVGALMVSLCNYAHKRSTNANADI